MTGGWTESGCQKPREGVSDLSVLTPGQNCRRLPLHFPVPSEVRFRPDPFVPGVPVSTRSCPNVGPRDQMEGTSS